MNKFNHMSERDQARVSSSKKFKTQVSKDREQQDIVDRSKLFYENGGVKQVLSSSEVSKLESSWACFSLETGT